MIEKTYRTHTDRENRAIAGLSMGSGQAMQIGMKSPFPRNPAAAGDAVVVTVKVDDAGCVMRNATPQDREAAG